MVIDPKPSAEPVQELRKAKLTMDTNLLTDLINILNKLDNRLCSIEKKLEPKEVSKTYHVEQVVCVYCNSPEVACEETKDYYQYTCSNCEVSWGVDKVNGIEYDNGNIPKNIPEYETPISGPDLRKDYIPNGTNGYLLGKGKCVKCNQDLDFCGDCRNAACKGRNGDNNG